jgi:hypothetical protein
MAAEPRISSLLLIIELIVFASIIVLAFLDEGLVAMDIDRKVLVQL